MDTVERSASLSWNTLPDSSYARKLLLLSIPLMLLLSSLLFETYQRSKFPPYASLQDTNSAAASSSTDGENTDDSANSNNAQSFPVFRVDLKYYVFLYLWISFLCLITMLHAWRTTPQKILLLRKFLDQGLSTVGDVFYPNDHTCYGLCPQYGTITYSDLRPEYQNNYIQRKVRLHEKFSREWVPILVLPEHPYSGHPKLDLEMAYLATEREKHAMQFLGWYSLVWVVLNIAASLYVLYVMGQNQVRDEFPRRWMWFGICLAILPILAFVANSLICFGFTWWMIQGDGRSVSKKSVVISSKMNESEYHKMSDPSHPRQKTSSKHNATVQRDSAIV